MKGRLASAVPASARAAGGIGASGDRMPYFGQGPVRSGSLACPRIGGRFTSLSRAPVLYVRCALLYNSSTI